MTNPDTAVKYQVRGLYGGRTLPAAAQLTDYRPTSWNSEPDLWKVVVKDCQGCHTLSEEDILSLNYWKSSARNIREEVFHERLMPNSPNGLNNFFNINPDHSVTVDDALRRFGSP